MRKLSLYFSLLTWLIYSVTAQAPVPRPPTDDACHELYRQAWLRQDAGLSNFSPCAITRVSADCVNYPLGFESFDYVRDCGNGKACAQVKHPPGLYCWDGVQMAAVVVPIRINKPPSKFLIRR